MRPQGSSRRPDKLLAVVVVTRRTLVRAMSALGSACDAEVIRCYEQMVAAAEQSFQAEELAAEHFSHRAVHEQRERHARVLSGLHQASTRIQAGELGLAREALVLLSRFLLLQRPGLPLATGGPGRPLRPRRGTHRPVRSRRMPVRLIWSVDY